MPELCDRCDYRKPGKKCKIPQEARKYFIERDLCNFAVVDGHIATMKADEYFSDMGWHNKSDKRKPHKAKS